MLILATILVSAIQLLTATPTLEVPALDVRAPLVAVGFNDDGGMEVPDDVREVGWWKYGSAPGDNIVLAGHISSRIQGKGVFYHLTDLRPGDKVFLDGASFTVRETVTIVKHALPVEEIFIGDAVEELVLITCGGGFNPQINRFDSNTIVWAVPDG